MATRAFRANRRASQQGRPRGEWLRPAGRLYLEIPYLYFGNTYRYRPDFVVRLTSGLMVLLEGKGEPSEKDDAKATAARRWVQAVNTWGGLGTWVHHICYDATTLNADLITLLDTVAEDSPAAQPVPTDDLPLRAS